jgi:hypothetical protein
MLQRQSFAAFMLSHQIHMLQRRSFAAATLDDPQACILQQAS